MTKIAVSVGIDEATIDWLCEALRQADFLLHAVMNNTFYAESVFALTKVSIARIRRRTALSLRKKTPLPEEWR